MTAGLQEPSVWNVEHWPQEVRRIMSWLDCQPEVATERRKYPRARYRVRAAIGLVGDIRRESMIIPIYTRDACISSMGFIAHAELPIAAEARLHLPLVDDRIWYIDCTIIRCLSFVTGWYEGAVKFNEEQRMFAASIEFSV
jgi:hypothetical protein